MELNRSHFVGMGIGISILIAALFLMKTRYFFFLVGISIILSSLPFILSIIQKNREESEKESMFLEFSRNLVESVKSGTPINKSIINVKNKEYGALTPHIRKLANQISLGIPLRQALEIFSKDVKNKTVSRALTLIGQAEKAGGNIGGILESVGEAVSMSDKLKKERLSSISALISQGYLIFFIFIVIILVMQFKILPMISGISGSDMGGIIGGVNTGGTAKIDPNSLSNAFLFLLIVQGFFTGLTVGELSEGNVKAGIRHSFVLMVLAFMIFTGVNLVLGK
ncbi:MAG TPA: type II secretion system F family protein [Candidatus Pacearchaeota archaeon]|nr:type II secretion system F family protein [Candidatus Pacearchaeota archaeon]